MPDTNTQDDTNHPLSYHLDRLGAWLTDLWEAKSLTFHMCDGTVRTEQSGVLRDIRDDVMALRRAYLSAAQEGREAEGETCDGCSGYECEKECAYPGVAERRLAEQGLEAATEAYNKFECGSDVDHVRSIIRAYLSTAQEGREAARIGDAVLDWMVRHGFLDGDSEYYARDAIEVLDELIDDPAPAQPAAQVVVNGLRWPPECPRGQRVHGRGAPFDGVEYCIAHYGGSHGDDTVYRWAAPKSKWSEPFDSFDAAKAAAQADYDKRILSALASPTDADAAGWVKDAEALILSPSPEEASIIYGPLSHEYLITLLAERDAIIRVALTAAKGGDDGR